MESCRTPNCIHPGILITPTKEISTKIKKRDGTLLPHLPCPSVTLHSQKMVDFFWNVGAPESEIDMLNEVGAAINPGKIGSWIDMSARYTHHQHKYKIGK